MSGVEGLATLLGRLQVAGGVDLAAVVSIDGFLIEATHSEGLDAEEFSAVATNGLMVAKAIGREIERGEIDPGFVITHRLPLEEAPRGFEIFKQKQDDCVKVVLTP